MRFADILPAKQGFWAGKPVAKEEIIRAEKELNLQFSQEYTEYIAQYGYASVYAHEFTGLGCADRLDVVKVTQDQRGYDASIPGNLYVVEETHMDGICIWQDCEGNVYSKSPNSPFEKIASSLQEYID